MKGIELIEAQQREHQNSPAWFVGEQLKEICRADSRAAEILERDLELPEMSIAEAEKKIAAFANENRKAGVGFCSGADADRILREFYGLPAPVAVFELADFL